MLAEHPAASIPLDHGAAGFLDIEVAACHARDQIAQERLMAGESDDFVSTRALHHRPEPGFGIGGVFFGCEQLGETHGKTASAGFLQTGHGFQGAAVGAADGPGRDKTFGHETVHGRPGFRPAFLREGPFGIGMSRREILRDAVTDEEQGRHAS